MILKIRVFFIFYRKFLFPSLILNAFLVFMKNPAEVTLLLKFFLFTGLFAWFRFTPEDDKLIFFRNFGISPRFLLAGCLIAEFILTAVSYKFFRLLYGF
ncbi:hypothetical protein SAMN05660413_01277 [Salegentibacter flavus]|uniref:Uncharacterized protein n=1 Tax=Salegentibacter flavus TaxID=287099 RepID=A0A1I4ZF21_9FLAO|nr:hypothetical protein SAMN05660413_01277 [Salegentibacter flavus]